MKQLAITISFCYQFHSEYYDKAKLNACVSKAVDEVDRSHCDINIVYDPIHEGLSSDIIYDNITKTIEKSHVVIFEISDINPNVLYELGVAKGQKKPTIILREESCKAPLPTDINSFLYITYCKDKLDSFQFILASKIGALIDDYSPEDLIPNAIKESIIREKLLILKDKNTFSTTVKAFIKNTETNIYYIGSMGFLVKADNWIDDYKSNLSGKIFSRIVYLKSLREIYQIYNDEDLLNDYCVWLAQNYWLLKAGVISLSSSPEVGIWKAGMSVIMADEKQVLVSTGTFNDFNNKGFVIRDEILGGMFKEYAKILAVTSKTIKHRRFGQYFSLSADTKRIPETIEQVIDKRDYQLLKDTCSEYVSQELAKML